MNRTTLAPTEPHPMASYAREVIAERLSDPVALTLLREAMASCAIEGNRAGEICGATLNRLLRGEPVSDRYIMGLALLVMQVKPGDTTAAGE